MFTWSRGQFASPFLVSSTEIMPLHCDVSSTSARCGMQVLSLPMCNMPVVNVGTGIVAPVVSGASASRIGAAVVLSIVAPGVVGAFDPCVGAAVICSIVTSGVVGTFDSCVGTTVMYSAIPPDDGDDALDCSCCCCFVSAATMDLFTSASGAAVSSSSAFICHLLLSGLICRPLFMSIPSV